MSKGKTFNGTARVAAMEALWDRFEKLNPSAAAAMRATDGAKQCAPALLDMYQAVVILHLLSGATHSALPTLVGMVDDAYGPTLDEDATLGDVVERLKLAPKIDGCEAAIVADEYGWVMRLVHPKDGRLSKNWKKHEDVVFPPAAKE
jgi:hypothetical protein